MRNITILSLIGLTLILLGCQGVDLGSVSDEDLARLSNKAVVCNEPYIRIGTGCCLDQNINEICDKDEPDNIIISPASETDNPDYCVLTPGYDCHDFVVYPNSIKIVLENKNYNSLTVRDWIVGDCSLVKTEIEQESTLSMYFSECNNGNSGDTFYQDIDIILNDGEKDITINGHLKAKIDELPSAAYKPERCSIVPGFSCEDFSVHADGSATVLIKNGMGKISSIKASLDGINGVCTPPSLEQTEITTCKWNEGELPLGKAYDWSEKVLEVTYTLSGSDLSKTALGELIIKYR